MKKILHAVTALTLVLISTNLMAQYSKGGKFVEAGFGNIGFSKQNNKTESGGSTSKDDSRSFNFSLYPRMGFFIADNLAVGAEVDIYIGNSKSNGFNSVGVKTSESNATEVSLGFGPFARYYFAGDDRSKFYAQVAATVYADLVYNYDSKSYSGATGALTSSTKYDYKKKLRDFGGTAAVGWNKMLADNVALNLSLGYRFVNREYTYNYTTTPVVGPPSTSPDLARTSNQNSVTWNIGFTMFFPSAKKHKK